jgi:predicted RNase H-like HicB family nuclease
VSGDVVKPVLQALLLADRIYVDKQTGKRIIAGTFNRLAFKKRLKTETAVVDGEERQTVPGGTQVGSPSAYISLTELRGEITCILRYVNLEHDKAIFQTQFTIKCDNPLKTVELTFPLPPLPNVAGVHALELLCDDEPIGSHRIIVEEIVEETDNDDPLIEEPTRFGNPLDIIDQTPWETLGDRVYECRVLVCPEDEGGYSVHALRLPGVVSQGETIDEALANISEAFAGAMRVYLADNMDVSWENVDVDRPKGSIERWILVDV